MGRPGIVIISPVWTTTKPAPADTFTLDTVMVKPSGRPSLVWSSVRDYWVLAMHTGRPPMPILSSRSSSLDAAAE